jgi:hypothetical protein
MTDCAVSDSLSQRGDAPSDSERGRARVMRLAAGPLTGSIHCALLRVVMRLAGLPRNGALALSS